MQISLRKNHPPPRTPVRHQRSNRKQAAQLLAADTVADLGAESIVTAFKIRVVRKATEATMNAGTYVELNAHRLAHLEPSACQFLQATKQVGQIGLLQVLQTTIDEVDQL